jgi:hypothetical protein
LKPRNNKPFYNEIPGIKNLILSPSINNIMIKSLCNNKTPTIKNKIFGPFRFVKTEVSMYANRIKLAD